MHKALTQIAIRRLYGSTETNHSICDAKPPTFIMLYGYLYAWNMQITTFTTAVTPMKRPKLCFIKVKTPKATANVISNEEQADSI